VKLLQVSHHYAQKQVSLHRAFFTNIYKYKNHYKEMNFRFTKGKVIAIFAVLIVIWVFVFAVFRRVNNSLPQFLIKFFGMHDTANVFAAGNIILFVIEFVVLYLVFSLLQLKKVVIN
jgi:hypothetical protein